MNRIIGTLVFVSTFWVTAASAQPPSKATSVVPSGKTTLVARSADLNVRAVITTAATQRARGRWDPRFYFPKSWVDNIVITVNGKDIPAPFSAFLDLFDLHEAEVKVEGKKGVLALSGADASLSYWAEIDFDAEGVTRRRLGSGLVEGAVSSETVYHVIIVK